MITCVPPGPERSDPTETTQPLPKRYQDAPRRRKTILDKRFQIDRQFNEVWVEVNRPVPTRPHLVCPPPPPSVVTDWNSPSPRSPRSGRSGSISTPSPLFDRNKPLPTSPVWESSVTPTTSLSTDCARRTSANKKKNPSNTKIYENTSTLPSSNGYDNRDSYSDTRLESDEPIHQTIGDIMRQISEINTPSPTLLKSPPDNDNELYIDMSSKAGVAAGVQLRASRKKIRSNRESAGSEHNRDTIEKHLSGETSSVIMEEHASICEHSVTNEASVQNDESLSKHNQLKHNKVGVEVNHPVPTRPLPVCPPPPPSVVTDWNKPPPRSSPRSSTRSSPRSSTRSSYRSVNMSYLHELLQLPQHLEPVDDLTIRKSTVDYERLIKDSNPCCTNRLSACSSHKPSLPQRYKRKVSSSPNIAFTAECQTLDRRRKLPISRNESGRRLTFSNTKSTIEQPVQMSLIEMTEFVSKNYYNTETDEKAEEIKDLK